jgi:NAD(P)H-hydrate epimerase
MDIGSAAARPLVDAEGARAADAHAIDGLGIPGIELMERAGAGAERMARGRFPGLRRVAIACGAGQNGGDGFVVARLLRARGVEMRVARVATRPSAGDAATALERLERTGVRVEERPDGCIGDLLLGVDLVVDALLGTGGTGAPEGGSRAAVEAIVEAGLPVLALDVPSGVDASTGEVPGAAVRADATATFHADKVGLRVAPGCEHAGEVVVVPIGIPEGATGPIAGVAVGSAEGLVPARTTGGSKYEAGAVLVVGGAPGMAGAPSLAAAAALRAGAGLATLVVPETVGEAVAGWQREAMAHAVAAGDERAAIERLGERARAVVIGPGLGRGGQAEALLEAALALDAPAVVDADALWWLARDPGRLRARTAPTAITPHAGEAARLLDREPAEIAARRLASARALVDATGSTVLLKGRDTLVVDASGRLGVRDGSCAALATAGSGDVLAGVVGAFLARGADPWTAAVAAAAEHLRAARAAVGARGGGAIIAGDLIGSLRAPD